MCGSGVDDGASSTTISRALARTSRPGWARAACGHTARRGRRVVLDPVSRFPRPGGLLVMCTKLLHETILLGTIAVEVLSRN
jgi:hypothetical protein